MTSSSYQEAIQYFQQIWKHISVLTTSKPDDLTSKRAFRSINRIIGGLSDILEDCNDPTAEAGKSKSKERRHGHRDRDKEKESSTEKGDGEKGEKKGEDDDEEKEGRRKKKKIESAKLQFGKIIGSLLSDVSNVASTYALSPVPEIYQNKIGKVRAKLKREGPRLLKRAQAMTKINTNAEAGSSFENCLDELMSSYEEFSEKAEHPEDLQTLLPTVLKIHSGIELAFGKAMSLTDIKVKHPDYEAVSKLPENIALPEIPEQGEANDSLSKSVDRLEDSLFRAESSLSEMKTVCNNEESTNDEIIQAMDDSFKAVNQYMSDSLSVSVNSYNVSTQTQITSDLSGIVRALNSMNTAVKSRLLLKKGWQEQFNSALDLINKDDGLLRDIASQAKIALSQSQQEEAAADSMRQEITEIAKPVLALKTRMERFVSETKQAQEEQKQNQNQSENTQADQNSQMVEYEKQWATSVVDLAVTDATAIGKILMYLRGHPKEMNCSPDELGKIIGNILEPLNALHEKSLKIIKGEKEGDLDIETECVNMAKSLTEGVQSIQRIFDPKTSESMALRDTLGSLLRGIESISKAAMESKQKRLEAVEAAEKRRQAILEKRERAKKLNEERRLAAQKAKEAAAKKPVQKAPEEPRRTKDELMNRLKLEAAVIKCRYAKTDAEKRLQAFLDSA